MSIREEMNVGAIAGTGDSRLPPDQREPGRPAEFMPMQRRKTRRGKFMNQETFIIPHSTFVSLREAKKKHKHYKKYLGEDDSYHDIREYAKRHKGPIIVEDEATGAMMYIRHGDGSLYEAWTNQVERSGARWLSRAEQPISDYPEAKKIGNYDKDHSVYKDVGYDDYGSKNKIHYSLVHNATGHITHSVNGMMKKGVLKIDGAGASTENKKIGSKVKMHQFYHHLLKRGAEHEASGSKEANQHPVALVGTSHSVGAQDVWRKAARRPDTTVAGWKGGKPVNLGKAEDPEETHATPTRYMGWDGDRLAADTRDETDVGNMKLVMSVHPKTGKKKLRFKRKR